METKHRAEEESIQAQEKMKTESLSSLQGSSRPKGYSHKDTVVIKRADWMKEINDNKRLRDLSIIGTHDTMSFYGGDMVQCQSMSLENQLEAGIRFLDIRCRHIEDVFAIHHGIVFQKKMFGDVLNVVKAFLTRHPSETVYMRVKDIGNSSKTTRDFHETFRDRYMKEYNGLFWSIDSSTSRENPLLSETRGKIVVLQDFDGKGNVYGLLWNDTNCFDIQDDYNLKTNWNLYDKWEKVKKKLDAVASSEKIVINFLSGSGGSFPYFVASGQSSPGDSAPRLLTGRTTPGWKNSWPDFPRVSCFLGICSIAFEGTNNLIINHLNRNADITKTGIIVADFPGSALITAIVEKNK